MKFKKILIFLILSLVPFFCVNAEEISKPYLTNIKIDNYSLSPLFNKNIFVYNIFVNETEEYIKINVEKQNQSDIVEMEEKYKIEDGKNEIIIKIINQNKEYNQYKLRVFKGKTETEFGLSKLSVGEYQLSFNKDIFEYSLNVAEDVNYLEVNYEVNNDEIVSVEGNDNLTTNNNLIKIKVRDKNNTKEVNYQIKVNKDLKVFKEEKQNIITKEKLTKKENIIIIASLLSIGMLILLFSFYMMFIRKFKRKN